MTRKLSASNGFINKCVLFPDLFVCSLLPPVLTLFSIPVTSFCGSFILRTEMRMRCTGTETLLVQASPQVSICAFLRVRARDVWIDAANSLSALTCYCCSNAAGFKNLESSFYRQCPTDRPCHYVITLTVPSARTESPT